MATKLYLRKYFIVSSIQSSYIIHSKTMYTLCDESTPTETTPPGHIANEFTLWNKIRSLTISLLLQHCSYFTANIHVCQSNKDLELAFKIKNKFLVFM